MKNKITTARFSDIRNGEPLSVVNILEIALRDPGEKGHPVDELMKRMDILDRLKSVDLDGDIDLTHEQWIHVWEVYSSRMWPVVDGVAEVARMLEKEME